MKIELSRVKNIMKENLVAYVDVSVGGCIIIKGCRIMNGTNGAWVAVPSKKDEKDGKYYDHVWFTTKELKKEFTDKVIAEYAKLDEKQEAPAKPEAMEWEE